MQQADPSGFAAAQGRLRFGALCWRMAAHGPEVLLITTRNRGLWIIPKGRAIAGLSGAETAAREAWEEAGVLGHVAPDSLGVVPRGRHGAEDPATRELIQVHVLAAREVLNDYPEAGQRLRLWLPPCAAARRVAVPGLARMLDRFKAP